MDVKSGKSGEVDTNGFRERELRYRLSSEVKAMGCWKGSGVLSTSVSLLSPPQSNSERSLVIEASNFFSILQAMVFFTHLH